MELSCTSSYSPLYAFYVGSAFSKATSASAMGLQPLADYDYDVIITTSDIPGSGTVRAMREGDYLEKVISCSQQNLTDTNIL